MMYRDYMEAGFKVFGLHAIQGTTCACGNPECLAAGKHPVASNWQFTPHWSDEALEGMEEMGHFETGYGVIAKGWLIVDVDARNGGVDSFHRLCADMALDLVSLSGFVVLTGSGQGSMHIYFKAPEGLSMVQNHPDYCGLDFKSQGYIVGAESQHRSGNRYSVLSGSPYEVEDAPASLLELLKRPESFRAEYNGSAMDVTEADLANMLSFVSPDCDHETWFKCGMAVHHATGGTGFDVWDNWSSKGTSYPGSDKLSKRWHSFGKSANPVTLGTLIHHAEAGGWEDSVEFTPTVWFSDEPSSQGEDEPEEASPACHDGEAAAPKAKKSYRPFHTNGIDLLRPPGFVGEVCKWINDQSRFPRENLAVAAALVAMSNVIGLRYTDDVTGVTANLFAMCVAGSATGKEAVMQSIMTIHQAAGIQRATVGAIKSDQEIIRNLTDNQAVFYIIDEFGIELKKITTSKEAYHQGVVGTLMAVYSKADGFYPMTGDSKRDVKNRLQAELRGCRKAISENDDENGYNLRRLPKLERAVKSIDNGLEKPYLSLIGFTTPITFDGLVTPEQARNGFIGRSILVSEKETNPRMKANFQRKPMGDRMKMTIIGLYQGGVYDQDVDRVEHYEERSKISTDHEARDMLSQVYEWSYLEAQKMKTVGLEAIPRRAHEMVSKISLILAAPSGIRTAEHVRWSFAFVERDIAEKCNLALANEADTEEAGGNIADAIAYKIIALLGDGHTETRGVIVNRCKKWPKDKVEHIIDQLIELRRLISDKLPNPTNGRVVERLSLPVKPT